MESLPVLITAFEYLLLVQFDPAAVGDGERAPNIDFGASVERVLAAEEIAVDRVNKKGKAKRVVRSDAGCGQSLARGF